MVIIEEYSDYGYDYGYDYVIMEEYTLIKNTL